MKTLKQTYLLTFLLLLCSSFVHASAPVWKVSKNGQHLYIGGTIHVLGQKDYPLPSAFELAYQQANTLVLEADLSMLETPDMQSYLINQMSFPHGKTLRQVLNKKTLERLKRYLAKRKIPLNSMLMFKPGMLVSILTMAELQRLNIAGDGVDTFYDKKATADSKNKAYLETITEQLTFLSEMGMGKEDDFINQTLDDMKDLDLSMRQMKSAWQVGNMQKLQQEALASWEQQFPALFDSIITQRNNNWIPKLEAMLSTKDIELVLVGALHLVGKHGVLSQLKARGYSIKQLN